MKRWLALFWVLSLLRVEPLKAQTRAADSLRTLLNKATQADTTRVRRLQSLSNELLATDLPQAVTLLKEALTLSQRIHDQRGEGRALISLGTAARLEADYPQARRYTQQAQALFRRRNDRKGLGKVHLQLSLIEMIQENLAPALRAALQGLPYAEQAGDHATQAQLQFVLGSIYVKLENYQEALPVLQATLRNGEKLGDEYVVAATLELLGNTYQMLKDWPKALTYFRRAVQLNQRLGDVRSATGNEAKVAELYEQQGSYKQALMHGFRARNSARANKDTYNLPAAELTLAKVYLASGNVDSAIILARRSFDISQRTHSNEYLRNASNVLAQAYARRRDFAQAYRYQSLWVAYRDSVSGEETQRKTSALRYGYELDKKQAQIALLNKKRQLQRQQLYGLLAGLGGVLLLAGLLLRNILLKQRINQHLKEKNSQIAAQRDALDRTLVELRATQNQLVQREKMASLGELTAGVAHEIQNPLNFVTNFSDLNAELMTELGEELAKEPLSVGGKEAIDQLMQDLAQNHTKIHQHGRRADRIVKSMLEHSRASQGQRQATNLNALVEESLRLAYHGEQVRNKEFQATLTTKLDPGLEAMQVVPQDLSRVLLNLLTNAFYAVAEKRRQEGEGFQPEVCVQTQRTDKHVCIRVRDNGNGIPAAVREKIFQPFFTTKPTGEGTGLGLSLSYDIVTKGHGGTLSVESQEGQGTEFTICLPAEESVS
ncbi:ATP-binding protein [Hymenobacter cavernae]|uniref:histidine kinase n=1 Tax=Hymenobacter cavernae TaxID=2044852 RepID=A0ABQ1UWM8_9BACT|nr:ATP-binding protein [Hymenobacter cavernae]GGF26958.1 hypothetical protein GCM10011383_43140 [Hymenobacter cavernae]